jgi:simple sugar transport system substrate-binding protein
MMMVGRLAPTRWSSTREVQHAEEIPPILITALVLGLASTAMAKTFFWISHGDPADPVWTYFLQGAEQWAEDTGNTVNTSFHSGDVPSHQEAFRAAITAGADGIVTSTPDPGTLNEVIAEAHAQASRSSSSTPRTP